MDISLSRGLQYVIELGTVPLGDLPFYYTVGFLSLLLQCAAPS
jgi:hypothetical protein